MADANDESIEMDPSIMEAMGFGSFGMQKKPVLPQKPASNANINAGPIRKAKRQKPNPQQTRPQGSGANNTPLSTRQPSQRTATDPNTSDRGLAVHQKEEDGDPGYDDSDPEPEARTASTTRISLAPTSSLALPARPPPSEVALQEAFGNDASVPKLETEIQADSVAYDPKHPPASRRLSNGDYAYFLPSFVADDPWAGMVPVPLREKVR